MNEMDRLTVNDLEYWEEYGDYDVKLMARELLAHRCASQAAPAPVAWFWERGGDLELTLLKDGQYGKCLTAQGFTAHPLYRAPAPSAHAISKEWAERMLPLDEGVTPSAGAPAPSDGLREALEECDCCVDGLQADGETPCPYCTKPKVPIADAAEALLEAHKSGAWPVGQGRTLQQVATIIDALLALRRAAPTEGEA